MADGDIWVEHRPDETWGLRIEEQVQPFDVAPTQTVAIARGRAAAKRAGVSLVILNPAGLLQAQVNYRSSKAETDVT